MLDGRLDRCVLKRWCGRMGSRCLLKVTRSIAVGFVIATLLLPLIFVAHVLHSDRFSKSRDPQHGWKWSRRSDGSLEDESTVDFSSGTDLHGSSLQSNSSPGKAPHTLGYNSSHLGPQSLKFRDDLPGDDWKRIGRFQFNIVKDEPFLQDALRRQHKGSDIITTVPVADGSITSNVCDTKAPPFLVVLVPSLPQNKDIRHAIRTTWARHTLRKDQKADMTSHNEVAVLFVFGTDNYTRHEMNIVSKESLVYGDVIAGKFIDSYQNLTLKVMFGMRWTLTSCPGIKFMAKVDQDTFLNLDLLLDMLQALQRAGISSFVLGYHHLDKRPRALRETRWAVKEEVYPHDFFPRYLYGHSYVMSAALLGPVLRTARRLPYFPPEDAFFTGVLPLLLNLTRLHSQRFAVSLRTVYACDLLSERALSATSLSTALLLEVGAVFRRGRCDPAHVIRKSNYRFADNV